MSLIEKLGGYDEASEIVAKSTSWSDTYLQPTKEYVSIALKANDGMHLNIEEIKKELLEYRRQHGIFEPDDWIIFDGELMVFALWSKHSPDHAYIGYAYAEDGQLEHKSTFRHATDAEIAQGYRDE